MILKPQDVVILLKLVVLDDKPWTYLALAHELSMSASEVHAGLDRAQRAHLMNLDQRQVIRQALVEFVVHGVRYAYPPTRGSVTRGVPTGYAAPPLNQLIVPGDEPPPVWPDPDGSVRGLELSPLYKSAPTAAARDAQLYELLALVDAMRDGRARERLLASDEIKKRIGRKHGSTAA